MTGVAQIAETGASKKLDVGGFAVIPVSDPTEAGGFAGMTMIYASRRRKGAS